jgi:hypothetical protein
MNSKNESWLIQNARLRRLNRNISPSLRLVALAHNRALLRWLRSVELLAWQDADARGRPRAGAGLDQPAAAVDCLPE